MNNQPIPCAFKRTEAEKKRESKDNPHEASYAKSMVDSKPIQYKPSGNKI